jgi:hypothetical protein
MLACDFARLQVLGQLVVSSPTIATIFEFPVVPSAWGGRMAIRELTRAKHNDLHLLLEVSSNADAACTARVSSDFRRAIGQLGHHKVRPFFALPLYISTHSHTRATISDASDAVVHTPQPGVIICGAVSVLLLGQAGLSLPGTVLTTSCAVTIAMLRYGLPLRQVRSDVLCSRAYA